MNSEAYCAQVIQLTEGENFLSVGDNQVASLLNPHYAAELKLGRGLSLPDLLSQTQTETGPVFRLREVKFKLEKRLILKAIRQLKTGVELLKKGIVEAKIDRLEIVIPLQGRALKKWELPFLGMALDSNRYCLKMEEISMEEPELWKEGVPLSILLL